MYGTQDASSVWQETYTELLEQNGITHGHAWPAVFCSKSRDIKLLVHGDDFLVLGDEDAQNFPESLLRNLSFESMVALAQRTKTAKF